MFTLYQIIASSSYQSCFFFQPEISSNLKGWTSRVLLQDFTWLQKNKTFWTPSHSVWSSGNVSSETIKKYIEESSNL
ncbi:MAG: transposase [Candidatus Hodarchaeales archaeon]